MKFLVLLTVVAFCSAYPYQTFGGYGYGSDFGNVYGYGHDFHVNPDGSVTIITGSGKEITISKGTGLNNFVSVADPGVGHGYFNFYKNYYPSHVGILEHIISQYQGEVSPSSYHNLLGDIYGAVQSGQLDDDLYWALHSLHSGVGDVVVPSSGVHGVFGSPWGSHYGYPVGQHILHPLSQIAHDEKVILGQQSQIHEDQKLQHYQQEKLAQQQWYHQKLQEQQLIEQKYVQQLQEQVQDEQAEVLEHQKYHHLPGYFPSAGGYSSGSFWHYPSSPYLHKGLYGLYGHGGPHNVPIVY